MKCTFKLHGSKLTNEALKDLENKKKRGISSLALALENSPDSRPNSLHVKEYMEQNIGVLLSAKGLDTEDFKDWTIQGIVTNKLKTNACKLKEVDKNSKTLTMLIASLQITYSTLSDMSALFLAHLVYHFKGVEVADCSGVVKTYKGFLKIPSAAPSLKAENDKSKGEKKKERLFSNIFKALNVTPDLGFSAKRTIHTLFVCDKDPSHKRWAINYPKTRQPCRRPNCTGHYNMTRVNYDHRSDNHRYYHGVSSESILSTLNPNSPTFHNFTKEMREQALKQFGIDPDEFDKDSSIDKDTLEIASKNSITIDQAEFLKKNIGINSASEQVKEEVKDTQNLVSSNMQFNQFLRLNKTYLRSQSIKGFSFQSALRNRGEDIRALARYFSLSTTKITGKRMKIHEVKQLILDHVLNNYKDLQNKGFKYA